MSFAYPASFTPEPEGGFTVQFRDVPSAITHGDDLTQARVLAADVLGLALSDWLRAADGRDNARLPIASPTLPGEELVEPVPLARIKLMLALLFLDSGMSKREFARRLGRSPVEVDRLLDPIHGTRLDTLEQAFLVLGKSLVIELRDAA